MTTYDDVHVDWRCHLGRHHFVGKQDDNPEIVARSTWNAPGAGRRRTSTATERFPAGVLKRGGPRD